MEHRTLYYYYYYYSWRTKTVPLLDERHHVESEQLTRDFVHVSSKSKGPPFFEKQLDYYAELKKRKSKIRNFCDVSGPVSQFYYLTFFETV